ncbi:MAG: PQQ-binding-like beta-propeller repeat protein [bacterium]|jgi:outer membrane protein assembly factor BamB
MLTKCMYSLIWMYLIFGTSIFSYAEDWRMWRYDANRTAASPQVLADELHLVWTREYPQLEPVWDDPLNQDMMPYDTVYEPIVYGKTLFLGFNQFDRVTAIDTETGEEKWSFHVDGPVRFSPVVENGKVYFVSDDGNLYCLDAEQGALLWKYQGITEDRKILGNERLISTWCARGGPVIKDGIIYFASGIWPFMGVFIFALDAETGREVWVNDSISSTFINQPHNSPSFANIAPQGNLVVNGEYLLVPGGRSVPACFDLKTGEQLYFHLSRINKTGGAFVSAIGDHFVNYYRDSEVHLFDIKTGDKIIDRFGKVPVLTPEAFYSRGENVVAYDYANLKPLEVERTVQDSETKKLVTRKEQVLKFRELWKCDVDAQGDLIKAGNRLYAAGKDQVAAIDIPTANGQPKVSWKAEIEGMASRLVAADDKLFVVTLDGTIYAFGANQAEPKLYPYTPQSAQIPDAAEQIAKNILDRTGQNEGYALIVGSDADVIESLVQQSAVNVISLQPDNSIVEQMRKRFTSAGIYGKRLTVLSADTSIASLPPYIANLIVVQDSEKIEDTEFLGNLYKVLRPYGGTIYIPASSDNGKAILQNIQNAEMPNAKIQSEEDYLLVIREGALPGSDDWTHQYGDIANTVKSDDELVKLPLGLLWFGGSSNMDVLPRHGHGPPEQIVGGRLFIEGMDSLSARDVYTGRVLWKRELPHLDNYGVYYDDTYKDTPLDTAYNQIHIPGANARGTNYVVTEDKVYIVQGDHCLVLDPKTGRDIGVIKLPLERLELPESDESKWGYIGVYEDYLIAGAGMVKYTDFMEIDPELTEKKKVFYNFDITSSRHLVVMNRHSGEVLWTFKSDLGLLHNAIAVGADTIFCIDKMPDTVVSTLKRRGRNSFGTPRLLAFDIHSGETRWSHSQNIFGTWLSYSTEHDILLQSGRKSRDMLVGELDQGMSAFRGKSGEPLWLNPDDKYSGPPILHHETIITEPNAFNLLTGEKIMRENPLTGEPEPWSFSRNYGCNYAIASENMMTFRSAAAGFFDLTQDAGTGNFGGFKSGCTSNLVAADGVLNAPDYTRTCSCSYQNQTSLALIHDPAVEIWTFNELELGSGPIQQLGINLGAPGDRRADNGTLWLDYPLRGGPSPDIQIETTPSEPEWFQHHSLRMSGTAAHWITASGLRGVEQIRLTLAEDPQPMRYTIRLYFMEPEIQEAGGRVFHVSLQGKQVLQNFDIFKETQAIRSGIVKEFHDIEVSDTLTIDLTTADADSQPPVICGIEVLRKTELSMDR